MQADLVVFLELRRLMSDKDQNKEAIEKKLQKVAKAVAAQLPDPHRAEDNLQRLKDLKDNHVTSSLLQALGFGAATEVCDVTMIVQHSVSGDGALDS